MPIKSNNVDETGEQKIRSHFLLDLPDAQCEKITQKVSFYNIIELAVKQCYQTGQQTMETAKIRILGGIFDELDQL